MDIDPKYLLIGVAAAALFWPQLQILLKQATSGGVSSIAATNPATTGGSATPPSSPQSRVVGSDRGAWLQDLLGMQRVLEQNGQKEAADLISQAMVKIVGMKDREAA